MIGNVICVEYDFIILSWNRRVYYNRWVRYIFVV